MQILGGASLSYKSIPLSAFNATNEDDHDQDDHHDQDNHHDQDDYHDQGLLRPFFDLRHSANDLFNSHLK